MSDSKYAINDDQLRVLLYVVEDLQKNISHYGTGFAMLKAILTRNFNCVEVHELMKKTGELSIIAYNDSVRYMARKVSCVAMKRVEYVAGMLTLRTICLARPIITT